MEANSRAIADIRIGDRIRKTFGDIDALAASIKERGLLQPIGIRPDNSLVCGERRIRAFKQLERTEIPVYVCEGLEDELRCLEAERDENTCRQGLTPVEARDQQQRLEPMYAKQAQVAKIEAKTQGAAMTTAQRDTLSMFSQVLRNRRTNMHGGKKGRHASDRTPPCKCYSHILKKDVRLWLFGGHVLRMSNNSPVDSSEMYWDGQRIEVETLIRIMRFDLDPDDISKPIDWRRRYSAFNERQRQGLLNF